MRGAHLRVLHGCNLVIANQILAYASTLLLEVMITQPSLICYLMGHELCVMTCGYTFVDHFILLNSSLDSCVNELGHFYIVSEHVYWEITSLRDGNEFFRVIIVICVLFVFLI